MNTSLKALIIEDEELLARALKEKIKQADADITIVDTLTSLKTSRRWFSEHAEPDLIFMDIQLSDGISFDIFKDFMLKCPVIFTTAYDEYAVRAFKVNGIDYLLKPVDPEELASAIQKARAILKQQTTAPAGDMQQLLLSLQQHGKKLYKERFMANVRNQWMPINTNDIACFIKDQLIYCHLLKGEKYIIDFDTLDEIEELLDPRQFYRASRQCLLNIDAVQTIRSQDNSKLVIKLKPPLEKLEVEMSRLRAPDFKKWIDR